MLTQRISRQGEKEEKNRQQNRQLSYFQALQTYISQPNFAIFLISLGTGHKVFTRGCGGYFWGVRKNPRTSEGGTKKTTECLEGAPKSYSSLV